MANEQEGKFNKFYKRQYPEGLPAIEHIIKEFFAAGWTARGRLRKDYTMKLETKLLVGSAPNTR